MAFLIAMHVTSGSLTKAKMVNDAQAVWPIWLRAPGWTCGVQPAGVGRLSKHLHRTLEPGLSRAAGRSPSMCRAVRFAAPFSWEIRIHCICCAPHCPAYITRTSRAGVAAWLTKVFLPALPVSIHAANYLGTSGTVLLSL